MLPKTQKWIPDSMSYIENWHKLATQGPLIALGFGED